MNTYKTRSEQMHYKLHRKQEQNPEEINRKHDYISETKKAIK